MTGAGGRLSGCALSLLLAALLLLAGPVRADATATAVQAQERARAVTQVVLGIFSYARWPVAPVPLRLCLVGPTEYADDLIKGNVQKHWPAASGAPSAGR